MFAGQQRIGRGRMATVKKGMLAVIGEWAKHLRRRHKRPFWKRERQAERRVIRKEAQKDV
jgi:hypothetical protein